MLGILRSLKKQTPKLVPNSSQEQCGQIVNFKSRPKFVNSKAQVETLFLRCFLIIECRNALGYFERGRADQWLDVVKNNGQFETKNWTPIQM